MSWMRYLLFGFVLLVIAFSFTTKEYPQDYFRSPVNYKILLSGTFGELRPNHFHAGIDIKGKVGDPLYAIADGYVSRIKVQSGGYGNVLYIDHPNGYTSVYAHLQKFPTAIATYVKAIQYERETFEVDLYPEANQFNVAKGEQLGKMGLSGRSYGPHLHFEIRDTETEKPINPLLFGLDIKDNIAPKLHQLRVYYLNKDRETVHAKSYNLQKLGNNKYRIKGDTLTLGAWRVGFALKAYDHMNGTSNWNGIYTMNMYNDDSLWYNMTMETFSFDETRYINAHLDYEEQVSKKSYFNRCYELAGNELSIYKQQTEGGVVPLSVHNKNKITMKAQDVNGNEAVLEFWAKRGDVKDPNQDSFNYMLFYDQENVIDNGALKLYFPKGVLYENLYMKYQSSPDESDDVFSSVHHIHNYKTPAHKYYDITMLPKRIPEGKKEKLYIAYCDKKNRISSCGGTWEDGMLKAKVRDFGDYCIMMDDVPPTIQPISFKKNMKGRTKMSFKITDNLRTARNVDDLHFSATIDGQWVLMNYDAKNDLLTHYFEKDFATGEHQLRLVVTDDRNNEQVYERTFLR